MDEIFVRNPYNYDTELASRESGLYCDDVSLAVQSAAEECDINTIVRRFGLTGELPDAVQAPTYGDFTGVTDYQTAMNAVVAANEAFDAMPADVRLRFNNDPAAFVDFCSNEANADEMRKLNLFSPEAIARREAEKKAAETPPPA